MSNFLSVLLGSFTATVACVVGAGVAGEDALEVVAQVVEDAADGMAGTSVTGERHTGLRLHGAARAEKLELHEAT